MQVTVAFGVLLEAVNSNLWRSASKNSLLKLVTFQLIFGAYQFVP